jgi:hypothetical protein
LPLTAMQKEEEGHETDSGRSARSTAEGLLHELPSNVDAFQFRPTAAQKEAVGQDSAGEVSAGSAGICGPQPSAACAAGVANRTAKATSARVSARPPSRAQLVSLPFTCRLQRILSPGVADGMCGRGTPTRSEAISSRGVGESFPGSVEDRGPPSKRLAGFV